MTDAVDWKQAAAEQSRAQRHPATADAVDILNAQIAKRDARIAELEAALRAVRADRPSAHSDEVWRVIVAALGTEPQP